jgi:large subunit ribosomal protein L39
MVYSYSETKYGLQICMCVTDMSEMLMHRSALALVDDTILWDMNRPLEADCRLQLLHFREPDPYHVNKSFWRSCSMLLGALAENVFKEDVHVELHSFPSPNGLFFSIFASYFRYR